MCVCEIESERRDREINSEWEDNQRMPVPKNHLV